MNKIIPANPPFRLREEVEINHLIQQYRHNRRIMKQCQEDFLILGEMRYIEDKWGNLKYPEEMRNIVFE